MIYKAEFIRAITRIEQAPPSRPAVIFAGRSNVGKSSLINRLTGIKGLARTSNTPGRTREIHYYGVDDHCYFIDLPGYGFAKVSHEVQRRWKPMIERFFRLAEGIRLVVMIIDARRDPTPEDLQMLEWLDHRALPYIFAVTKCDKVGGNELHKRLVELQRLLGLDDDSALVPVSSHTGKGIPDLLQVIQTALAENRPESA